ncbi:D-Ala-D-Ala carboxypeptidase family metallohydrolase [Agrobacterium sp. BA1120]|uniref:YcbK family protein n=1 Tax=Agrobacterium sp. BA1120 TaxID=3228927 RepID=UPI003369EA28
MKIVKSTSAFPAQSCLAAVFLLALSGCVSAVSEDKTASATLTPATATAPTAAPSPEQAHATAQGQGRAYVDPAMVAASSARVAPQAATAPPQQGTQQVYGQAPQISGLTTQPTGISASSLSIYANSQPPAVASNAGTAQAENMATGSVPAYAPSPKITPALNSVYSAPATVQQPDPAQAAQQHSVHSVPSAATQATAQALPAKQTLPAEQAAVPIAAFFAGAAKKRGAGATAGLTQVAALPMNAGARQTAGIALNGRTSMTDEFDDTHVDADDDKPAGLMKLASLSGLSRVAPNGLLLQTEQVNVGCFKPEMIRRIKEVEAHYRKPAMVTSGYRPPKATTQGSKHYTCDAADIQVSGVSKWELANYLRSLPDRGGVGTYCHTESVHMDLGEPRDWNWRCRRTSASSL